MNQPLCSPLYLLEIKQSKRKESRNFLMNNLDSKNQVKAVFKNGQDFWREGQDGDVGGLTKLGGLLHIW